VKSFLSSLTSILTVLIVPLIFVRILLIPGFPALEYSMPGFPADQYGFSNAERVQWAAYGIQYLVNNTGPEYLADLRFSNDTPVFNEREVSHMLDVKIVVKQVLNVLLAALILHLVLGVVAWRRDWLEAYFQGISRGGWFLLALIVTLGLLAITSFSQFFTAFHAVFFEGDSWLFSYSDTLIRLYPIRFWQDVVLYVFGGAVLAGGMLGWFLAKK
jgi:integral membrane protein (TIGR01906 family)